MQGDDTPSAAGRGAVPTGRPKQNPQKHMAAGRCDRMHVKGRAKDTKRLRRVVGAHKVNRQKRRRGEGGRDAVASDPVPSPNPHHQATDYPEQYAAWQDTQRTRMRLHRKDSHPTTKKKTTKTP